MREESHECMFTDDEVARIAIRVNVLLWLLVGSVNSSCLLDLMLSDNVTSIISRLVADLEKSHSHLKKCVIN